MASVQPVQYSPTPGPPPGDAPARGVKIAATAWTGRTAATAANRGYLTGHRVDYYSPHKYLFFIGAVTSFLTSRSHSFSGE